MDVTVIDRIKTRRLQWCGHVSRMDSNRIPYLSLHTKLEGTRSRGRPRTRWRDGIMEDIQERGLNISEAMFLAKDRDGWRKFVWPYRHGCADGGREALAQFYQQYACLNKNILRSRLNVAA